MLWKFYDLIKFCIKNILELKNKHTFKYFTYIGYLYIFLIGFDFLRILKNVIFQNFYFKNLNERYGEGWVLLINNNNILNILERLNIEGYKIILICDVKDDINELKAKFNENIKTVTFDIYKNEIYSINDFNNLKNDLLEIIKQDRIAIFINNLNYKLYYL